MSSKSSPAMFRHIPANKLYLSRPTRWLTSRFHFSFAEYFNEKNTNFGVLRVLNDDLVTPRNGFGAHPHSNMEIISYIVSGKLSHQDSRGNKESLGRGCIQYMSAGTGIVHSEMNEDPNEVVRFLQLWVLPNQKGLRTAYGSRHFQPEDRLNKILQVVKGYNSGSKPSIFPAPKNGQTEDIIIHQDANIYVSEIEPGRHVDFAFGERRQAYLVCIEGTLNVRGDSPHDETTGDDISLAERDALEIRRTSLLILENPSTSSKRAHILMVEMAESAQPGGFYVDEDDY